VDHLTTSKSKLVPYSIRVLGMELIQVSWQSARRWL